MFVRVVQRSMNCVSYHMRTALQDSCLQCAGKAPIPPLIGFMFLSGLLGFCTSFVALYSKQLSFSDLNVSPLPTPTEQVFHRLT
jgi:hypothetical protein